MKKVLLLLIISFISMLSQEIIPLDISEDDAIEVEASTTNYVNREF